MRTSGGARTFSLNSVPQVRNSILNMREQILSSILQALLVGALRIVALVFEHVLRCLDLQPHDTSRLSNTFVSHCLQRPEPRHQRRVRTCSQNPRTRERNGNMQVRTGRKWGKYFNLDRNADRATHHFRAAVAPPPTPSKCRLRELRPAIPSFHLLKIRQ